MTQWEWSENRLTGVQFPVRATSPRSVDMSDDEAQELTDLMAQDQTSEAFRDMARNVAIFYRELIDGGVKRRDARDLTAEMQSVYACQMLGVEL